MKREKGASNLARRDPASNNPITLPAAPEKLRTGLVLLPFWR